MKLYSVLFSLVYLTAVSEQVVKECSSVNQDCSCKDVSYEICHNPPASQELHVGSLEECIQNCDIFGGFDSCNFLLYVENGPNENCKLIGDSTIEKYLDACGVVGQPLRDAYGSCVSSVAADSCALVGCDPSTTCHECDVNDKCGLYTQTECQKKGSPGESSDNIPNFETCLSLCTVQQTSNPFTYVTYDKEQQECICYPDGLRECVITVVPYGMSLEDVEHCDGCLSDADCPADTPVCSVLSGQCVECEKNGDCTDASKPLCDLSNNICIPEDCGGCSAPTVVCDPATGECKECLVDADCTDPAKPDCDLTDFVCKPECTQDSDCAAEDYCKLPPGACEFGCRNVGDSCSNINGDIGNCNGNHDCIISGDAYLTKVTIETRDCAGCSSLKAGSGASITMTNEPPSGKKSCATETLDNPANTDYTGQAVFENFEYLSTCFMFSLSQKVTDFKVKWTGAGTWTPEKFILERKSGADWPFCCYNEQPPLTLSDGEEKVFTCVESDASIGSNC